MICNRLFKNLLGMRNGSVSPAAAQHKLCPGRVKAVDTAGALNNGGDRSFPNFVVGAGQRSRCGRLERKWSVTGSDHIGGNVSAAK
jgi:hypothetical protein